MARNHASGGLLKSAPTDVCLGIDPSLTGFSLTAMDYSDGRYETWLYKSPERGVYRLMDISQWMVARFKELQGAGFNILDAAVEDTVVASYSATVMGELAGTVKITCLQYLKGDAKSPLKIPPTMVKKFATDKGNAKKNEVLLAVYKKWGVEFSDDNMADSFVIARMVRGIAETSYETAVLDKLNDPKFRDYQV